MRRGAAVLNGPVFLQQRDEAAAVANSAAVVQALLQASAVMWEHEKFRVIDCICRKALPFHMQLLLEHGQHAA